MFYMYFLCRGTCMFLFVIVLLDAVYRTQYIKRHWGEAYYIFKVLKKRSVRLYVL